MFEHVVTGIRSDADGRDAIALASELSSADGTLTLLHVGLVASKPAADSGAVRDAANRRNALERLEALAAEFQVDAQSSFVQASSARRALHEFARRKHADLLVIGMSHLDEVARDLSGDDTRDILQNAPCAIAVAPIGYAARAAAITKVGVAYDGSDESERALALARRLAAERGAELTAFEAVGAPLSVSEAWNVRDPEIDERVEQARRRIAALGDVTAAAGFGETVEELSRFGKSVDLLVLGSHRARRFDRLLRRTTAQQLADEASSPLLVLASDESG